MRQTKPSFDYDSTKTTQKYHNNDNFLLVACTKISMHCSINSIILQCDNDQKQHGRRWLPSPYYA